MVVGTWTSGGTLTDESLAIVNEELQRLDLQWIRAQGVSITDLQDNTHTWRCPTIDWAATTWTAWSQGYRGTQRWHIGAS